MTQKLLLAMSMGLQELIKIKKKINMKKFHDSFIKHIRRNESYETSLYIEEYQSFYCPTMNPKN